MKNLVLIFILSTIWFKINAQNLISNPGFEDIDSCYGNASPIGFDVFQWSGCTGWACPSIASSDLWCENSTIGNNSPPNIPIPIYQIPHSGKNYAGLLIFEIINQNYREYIRNKLIQPLESNSYYEFSLYISPNEGNINSSSCIQAYFSNAIISSNNYYALSVIPQWKNDTGNYIVDTIAWIKLTGVFKALGGENYVTIGCFDDSTTINVKDKNPDTTSDLYYVIDDVELIKLPVEIFIPNIFTPNNDNTNDLFEPKITGVSDYNVSIYNRWGNKIYELNKDRPIWDGKEASDGVYFYVFESKTYDIYEQGFFQLIR